ncbi:hypothetical protein ACRCUN_09395 [Mycobacterium sp. LTG2003]
MTALQDWLSISPLTPRAVRTLVCAPLRVVRPGRRPQTGEDLPRLLRPGVERC